MALMRAAVQANAPIIDTLRQADGYVIVRTRTVQLDTIVRPPVVAGPRTLVVGTSASPTVCPEAPYGFTLEGVRPDTIVAVLKEAARCKTPVALNPMGGNHAKYRSVIRGEDQFDMKKWATAIVLYKTPEIQAAIWLYRKWIIGMSMMDEPANISATNYWAPRPGIMTRAVVSELCRLGQDAFPGVPIGVVQDPRHFDTQNSYAPECEFSLVQYRLSKDPIDQFIPNVKAALRNSPHMKIMWSLNVLHGGERGTDCPKYGDDPRGLLCPMTGEQIGDFGVKLVTDPVTCGGLNTWRFQEGYSDKPGVKAGLQLVADAAAKIPYVDCGSYL